jgi:hypothetical protein
MAKFDESVVIQRPVKQVFAFVSNPENDPPWTSAAEMHRTSDGPIGIGTTFQQRDRFLGRRLDLPLEVVGYETNHSITVKTTSRLLSLEGTRIVDPVGDDATRVTFVGNGHAHGMWKLVQPLLAAMGGRRLRAQLARLKQLLEGQS